MTVHFTPDHYDVIREGIRSSAAVVVPELYRIVQPQVVIDVGCGEGWWLAEFANLGCEIWGYDSGDARALAIAAERYRRVDLTEFSLSLLADRTNGERCDLVTCLEVLEHLPDAAGRALVRRLCVGAEVVVYSAAIPGQGGQGHINEQWPEYWAQQFHALGWDVSGALRWLFWDDDRVENWYSQNMMLAVRDLKGRPDLQPLFEGPSAAVRRVVHPVLWESRQ